MKKIFFLLTILVSPAFAYNNNDAKEAPIDDPVMLDEEPSFDEMIDRMQNDPDLAGLEFQACQLNDCRTVRGLGTTKPGSTLPPTREILEKIVGGAVKASSGKASLKVTYNKETTNPDGTRTVETITVEIAGAVGGASIPEPGFEDGQQKQHM